MKRHAAVISVVAGLLVVFVGIVTYSTATPAYRYVVEPAAAFWYVGVAAAVASWLLGRHRTLPRVARLLGVVGVLWTTVVVGTYALIVLMFVLRIGAIGP